MFGFFSKPRETFKSLPWRSIIYRGGNAFIALTVIHEVMTQENSDYNAFLPDAFIHLMEAIFPSGLNDLMLGLHLGRIIQLSKNPQHFDSAEHNMMLDMTIHSLAALSRTPMFLKTRYAEMTHALGLDKRSKHEESEHANLGSPNELVISTK